MSMPDDNARAKLYQLHGRDGTEWILELLDAVKPWPVGWKWQFYNTNPGIWGVPDKTLDLAGWTYQTEDLIDALDEEEVVVLLHCGEVTRIDV